MITGGMATYVSVARYFRNRGAPGAPILLWTLLALHAATALASTEDGATSVRLAPAQTAGSGRTEMADSLSKYLGEHPRKVLSDPSVGPVVAKLLGAQYKRFMAGVDVAEPLELVGDYYFGAGCAPRACTLHEAAFAIDRRTGAIFVALFPDESGNKSGWFNATTAAKTTADLPAPLSSWLKELAGEPALRAPQPVVGHQRDQDRIAAKDVQPDSTKQSALPKARGTRAILIAAGHIAGSLAVVVAIGVAFAFLYFWRQERSSRRMIEEVSIALGVPPERLDDADIAPKVFGLLSTRFSDDRFQNRIADLFGSILTLLTWCGWILHVLILGAVVWFTFTDDLATAVYAWLMVPVEMIGVAIGLVASALCKVLTGKYPGGPKAVRKFLAGELAKRERSTPPAQLTAQEI